VEFYFLRQDLFGDATGVELVGHTELSAAFAWLDGVPFERPFPRETFVLDDTAASNVPDFFDTTVPVMSRRLLEALRACGVENLEAYPVRLQSPRGLVREDYLAVNVVGLVDAVDLAQSAHELRRGRPRFGGAIVIDVHKTQGLPLFRLPYSPRFIVVNEPIARALERGSFDGVLLQATRAYEGT
jgi:hypothetical protein